MFEKVVEISRVTFFVAFLAATCFLTFEMAQAQERVGAGVEGIRSTYVGGLILAASSVFARKITFAHGPGFVYLILTVGLWGMALAYYLGHGLWP